MTRAINTAWRGCRITTRRTARAGIGRSSPSAIRPSPRTSRAKRSACELRLPVAWIATPPIRVRGESGSAPRRPTAPSAASVVTAPAATTSRPSRLAFPTQRSSTRHPPRPQAVTQKRCNNCHILDPRYRQGDREKPGWVRSQGAGWTWSRCNTESGGAFGCVTCHDPHKGVRSTTTAQYEAKCLACHSATTVQPAGGPGPVAKTSTGPRPRVCSVDPAKGCIKCHMPGVRMDSSHREMTDHYIRIPRSRRQRAGRRAIPQMTAGDRRPARQDFRRWGDRCHRFPSIADSLVRNCWSMLRGRRIHGHIRLFFRVGVEKIQLLEPIGRGEYSASLRRRAPASAPWRLARAPGWSDRAAYRPP